MKCAVLGGTSGQQGHFPFGESWYQSGTTTKWMFTSYERDNESGLDYAMARFYLNRVASFCSADPIEGWPEDPQSWNRYAYVENDPINLEDPSGKGFWTWLIDIFIAILQILFPGNPSLALLGEASQGVSVVLLPPIVFSDGQTAQQPPPPPLQTPQGSSRRVYCDPSVMDAMRAAWTRQIAQNMIHPRSTEAGFPTYRQPGGGYNVGNDGPNAPVDKEIQTGSGTGWSIDKRANYDSTFHTHPTGTSGLPSTPSNHAGGGPGDSASAAASGKDIYVISDQGLSVAPGNGNRNGKDDIWIIQGNGIDDWLKKLKKKCM
jgi:RHS repeat-associated protein